MIRRVLLAGLLAGPAMAQQSPQPSPQRSPSQQTCVDVAVGTAQSYSCLNQQLGAAARQAHESAVPPAPYDATSPGNVTGQFNESATRNRLGTNFGHSVTPQRPDTAAHSPRQRQ